MRKTTANVASQLRNFGVYVSPRTVARLLRKLKFCLRVNQKRLGAKHPDRDRQFRRRRYPQAQRLLILADTTSTGLIVTARLDRKQYPVGIKPSAARLRQLNLTPATFAPRWNYTIRPSSAK
jgi:hypothetical protein